MIWEDPDMAYDPPRISSSTGPSKYWNDLGNGQEVLAGAEEEKQPEAVSEPKNSVVSLHDPAKVAVGDTIYLKDRWLAVEDIKEGKAVCKAGTEKVEVPIGECVREIPIQVLVCTNASKPVVILQRNGRETLSNIQSELEKVVDFHGRKFEWYYGGKVQEMSSTLESLQVKPRDKLLCLNLGYEICKFKRFTIVAEGRAWYMSTTSKDAVTFVPSRNILLFGFGMYYTKQGPETYTMSYEVKFGDEVKSSAKVEIARPDSTSTVREIYLDEGQTPINVPAGTKIGVSVVYDQFDDNSRLYVGETGETNVNEIEGNLPGLFEMETNSESQNGTGTTSGQIPELYYAIDE